MTTASEAPTEALAIEDPTEVLPLVRDSAPAPWTKAWVVPTQNSVYEVDFNLQRARQVSGANTTECFSPQGEWKRFLTCSFGYGGCLIFAWTRSAPHDTTVTSPVRPSGLRYSLEGLD